MVFSRSECLHNSFQVLLYQCVCFLAVKESEPCAKTLVVLSEHVLMFLLTELSAMAAVNATDLYVVPEHVPGESDNAIYESKH